MIILKILHFLALAVGLGGGVASAIVGIHAGQKAPEVSGAIQGRIGWFSFLAILVLWATGIAMIWGGAPWGGLWFWLKIAAVLALTGLAIRMRLAARTPGPETAALARKLGPMMTGAATLAVIFAVVAFS